MNYWWAHPFNCRAAQGQSERRAPRLRPERQSEHRLDSVIYHSSVFIHLGRWIRLPRRTDSSFAKQTRRYETFAVSWARAHNLPLKVRKYRTFVRTEVLSYEGTIILPEVLHYLRSNSFEGTFESTCTFVPSKVRNYDICTRTRVLYTYVYFRKQNDILISYLRTKVRRGQGL